MLTILVSAVVIAQSVSSSGLAGALLDGRLSSADQLLDRVGSLKHPMWPNDNWDVVSSLCYFADDDYRYFKVLRGIRWCKDHGADMNALDGMPLRFAIKDKHQMVMEMLLDYGAKPDLAPKGNPSPLILCALNGFTASATTLLKYKANPNYEAEYERKKNSRDPKGVPTSWTPLSAAAARGHLDIVKLLIQHKANVNWKNPINDRTPLHEAAAGNHAVIVSELLRAKAEKGSKDKSGQTPLALARKAKATQAIAALMRR